MDPCHGEISRAMRNRGIEVYIHPEVVHYCNTAHVIGFICVYVQIAVRIYVYVQVAVRVALLLGARGGSDISLCNTSS